MAVLRTLRVAMALACAAPAAWAQSFPFDQEMLLEAKRLPDSRRVPMMEIHADGKATVDLWCHTASAEVAISGSDIKFTFLSAQPQNCTQERIELDQQMGKALSEVTRWRRQGDIVIFEGPTTFRFRLSTH
jgi:hypothetical protein